MTTKSNLPTARYPGICRHQIESIRQTREVTGMRCDWGTCEAPATAEVYYPDETGVQEPGWFPVCGTCRPVAEDEIAYCLAQASCDECERERAQEAEALAEDRRDEGLVRHEDDLDWCYLCASVGEQTLATKRRHADIGTLTDSHGEHDLCYFCADQIDEAGPCETCERERAQEADEGVDGE